MATPIVLFKNNATSRLSFAIDAVTTSLQVTAGEGAKFPQPLGDGSNFFQVTLEDRRSNQIEICRCTGRSNDILNITRAQEGTTAQAFAMYATVSHRLTAGTMDAYFNFAYSKTEADDRFVNLTGNETVTGPIFVPVTDPVQPTELANKSYVDKRINSIPQLTVSSAASLVYQAAASQTVFNFLTPDIYGKTYVLSTLPTQVNPIDVYVAGLKKVKNTAGGLGDFTIDVANNRVTLDVGATVGQFVAFDIFTPRDVSPVVTTWLLAPIVPDGVLTHFEMRRARDGQLVDAKAAEEVSIYVNNVPQKPVEDYAAFGANLDFIEPPEADADVWGVWTKTGA